MAANNRHGHREMLCTINYGKINKGSVNTGDPGPRPEMPTPGLLQPLRETAAPQDTPTPAGAGSQARQPLPAHPKTADD